MRTAAAWSFPCGGCFLWTGGSAAVRIHPWICFEKFRTKEKLQHLHDAGVFGGRGWITQAAHLKRPRRGLFAAGTYSGGPYELRLPIFLQPLGGALKNRSAAPASPPCFRRRRTGCGTQHPLRLACVSLAAAPTTPPCFRRWRRSSSLRSAPLLFESTRLCESDICAKENRQCTSTPAVFSWARVDSNHRS